MQVMQNYHATINFTDTYFFTIVAAAVQLLGLTFTWSYLVMARIFPSAAEDSKANIKSPTMSWDTIFFVSQKAASE